MKRLVMLAGAAALALQLHAQETPQRDKGTFIEPQPGYYQNTILKQLKEADNKDKPKPKYFKAELADMDIPTSPDEFTKAWSNAPVSQGQTGTCWCFSTTSFYESEINRMTGQQVKLSEMYNVYWEYVERAKYFVQNRGNMNFGEGSETNALARTYKMYGVVPEEAYKGLDPAKPFHDHAALYKELDDYLKSVKERNAWNENEVVATTKSILNHYLGVPPTTVKVKGKEMSPVDYMKKELKLDMDNYVNFMSLMQEPFYQKAEYKVPDNWWHSKDYNNVPIEDFIAGLKEALQSGYTVSLGGDVSEAGFISTQNVAFVPSFDIPSAYIDDNARQLRFSNGSSTDDHAMHLIGYKKGKDGKYWFLLKDSGAGSRNCGESCKSFGYYYVTEDYIKLKMMTATVHKDGVKELLKKMKAS